MHVVPATDAVPNSVNKFLLPHERQVITVHFHLGILFGPIGLTAAGFAGALVSSAISAFSFDALLIIWLVWGLVFLYTIGKVLRWFVDYFVVTAQRVLLVKGLLTRDVISMPNVRLASMRLRRSVMGRVLGYGQFIFESERTQPVWKVDFMPYPEQLYLEISGLIFRDREETPD